MLLCNFGHRSTVSAGHWLSTLCCSVPVGSPAVPQLEGNGQPEAAEGRAERLAPAPSG